MEFIARHFALIIYLVGAIAALITGWQLYKEGYLVKLGEALQEYDFSAQKDPGVPFALNMGALVGALLFIAGTMPFFLFSFPIIYIVFVGIGGLTCYLKKRQTGKLDWQTLIFPVGIALTGILPFVVKNRIFYTISMAAGLVLMLLFVFLIELVKRFKPKNPKRHQNTSEDGPSPDQQNVATVAVESGGRRKRKKRVSRKTILIVVVIVCGGVGIWLANNYRPAPEISNGDVIDRYRYAFIAFSIGIFAAAYGYSRKIVLSLMSAALLFLPSLGLLYFLNAALDTPYKTSYLISDKYEKRVRSDNGHYTIYYLEGIDENTERATLFSSARGDFSMGKYRSIDPETEAYWMHVEEGEGFFDLRWRKEVFGLFDHPLPPPVDAPGK